MSTDQLNIDLEINSDGQLQPIDNTDYSNITDYDNLDLDTCRDHTVIEKVTGPNNFEFFRYREIKYEDVVPDFYKTEDPIELDGDGIYTYYKALLPVQGHTGNDYCYWDTESHKIRNMEGEVVSFEDFWEGRDGSTNVFSNSAQQIFTIFNIVKCFVLTERDRLNEVLKNGCDVVCKTSTLGLKANLLGVIVFLLKYYIDHDDYVNAQVLLDRIAICNGLCKDVNKHIKGCGCDE